MSSINITFKSALEFGFKSESGETPRPYEDIYLGDFKLCLIQDDFICNMMTIFYKDENWQKVYSFKQVFIFMDLVNKLNETKTIKN